MDLRLLVSVSVLTNSVFSEQCRRYDSDTLKEGQYLANSSFKQIKDSSLYSCAADCYSHSICRSFNLNKRTRTCFLNLADRTCPGRSLTSNIDFLYSTITGWDQGIAGRCERHTCKRDQQCHVTRKRSVVCVDRLTEGVDFKLEFGLIKDNKTWVEAGKHCIGRCGRLAVVNTAEKNRQVIRLRTQENVAEIWLGASDRNSEGVWMGIDGEELGYTNWKEGQPNDRSVGPEGEDCLTSRRAWFDKDCDRTFGFVCEYVIP